ncbi:hypothetical protein [Mycobacterium sp. ACS1612]|uniref:hypothetical protein n=1 Tax=Mycobacterium sp. ACS1612 TaxID=1834117 RepID=UPI0012EA5367|nr:hypothetical protein [Mycobacterium sp. ACS1612]
MTATDPNTATIAAAWASSELGQPEREVRYGFPPADPPVFEQRRPQPRRAILVAALAAGVIGGAVLGVTLFDFGASSQPPVVTPAPERAVVVGPSIPAPVPQQAPVVAPAPTRAPAAVGTPSAPAPDYPPLPPKPDDSTPEQEHPQPEPPDPVPPVPDDLGFKLQDPPKPKPDLTPDLPLTPAPKPDPKPQPPSLPDFGLQAPVKP